VLAITTGTVVTRGVGEGHFDVVSGPLKNHTSVLLGIAYRIVGNCRVVQIFAFFADMLVNAKRKF